MNFNLKPKINKNKFGHFLIIDFQLKIIIWKRANVETQLCLS